VNELQKKYSNEIETILAKYPPERRRSAVMPLLYLAQANDGSVTRQAAGEIADILEMGVTEVASIIGFYTLFHLEEGGRYRIQVCNDLPCALRGADEFLEELSQRLGIAVGETTADGLFTLEAVKCLAACDRAPMFQLQGGGDIKYYEDQSVDMVMALVEDLRQKTSKEGAA
jgi:NADH-quinone oxidoreductase subunit E